MITSEIKYYIQSEGDDNFGHRKEGEDQQNKGNFVSLSISCLLLILVFLFLSLTFISWSKNNSNSKIDEN